MTYILACTFRMPRRLILQLPFPGQLEAIRTRFRVQPRCVPPTKAEHRIGETEVRFKYIKTYSKTASTARPCDRQFRFGCHRWLHLEAQRLPLEQLCAFDRWLKWAGIGLTAFGNAPAIVAVAECDHRHHWHGSRLFNWARAGAMCCGTPEVLLSEPPIRLTAISVPLRSRPILWPLALVELSAISRGNIPYP